MNSLTLFSTAKLSVANLIRQSALQRSFPVILIALALALFGLPRMAQAVTPAPDGDYPGNNTAEGHDALFSRTTGFANTAIGFQALYSDSTGNNNTAIGNVALALNTNGEDNTATGAAALASNTRGNNNTGNGVEALYSNTTGNNNLANGVQALTTNTIGYNNTANGFQALFSNTTAFNNTATGSAALYSNTSGNTNTADGAAALYHNKTGVNNTAEGAFALSNNTGGSSNLALGYNAGANLTTGSNNIVIGAGVLGKAGEANTTRIGKTTQASTYIGGIYNKTVASATGVAVRIDSTGKLGTVLSSARYKDNIKPMEKASEAILSLKPVTFRYKQDLDPDGIPQFGLVAEQVEKVNPDLVVRDEDGKVTTVRYEAVNAMLLNEFLKEHRNVAEQQSTIAELKMTIAQQQKQFAAQQAIAAQQQKQIEVLTAVVQKVSERVELSAPVPQLAANED